MRATFEEIRYLKKSRGCLVPTMARGKVRDCGHGCRRFVDRSLELSGSGDTMARGQREAAFNRRGIWENAV